MGFSARAARWAPLERTRTAVTAGSARLAGKGVALPLPPEYGGGAFVDRSVGRPAVGLSTRSFQENAGARQEAQRLMPVWLPTRAAAAPNRRPALRLRRLKTGRPVALPSGIRLTLNHPPPSHRPAATRRGESPREAMPQSVTAGAHGPPRTGAAPGGHSGARCKSGRATARWPGGALDSAMLFGQLFHQVRVSGTSASNTPTTSGNAKQGGSSSQPHRCVTEGHNRCALPSRAGEWNAS
jgi:hypothetical protein